jgi:iron complex outermembrane recepter protein
LSFKIDGLVETRSGLVRNPLQTSRDYGEVSKIGFRIAGLWEPTDNVSVLYAYDHSRDKPTSNYYYYNATAQAAAVRPTFMTIDTDRVRNARVGLPVLRNPQRSEGHSVTAEWDATDNLTVRSISAWRRLDSTQWDQDVGMLTSWGANRRFGRLSFANVKQNQFSQELQLVGEIGDLKYVVGGYYFKERGRDVATVFSAGTLNAALNGVNLFPAPTPDAGATRVPDRASEASINSKALFGQATWSPSSVPGVHLTIGARYTDDHKDGRINFIAGANPNLTFVFDSSRVDPMATIGYDFSDDITTYVKWSRAYRAGGANSRSFTFSPFGEEELTAWEAGIKADLFDKHVRINLAAYASTLSDQQVDFINPANVSNTETRSAPEKRKIKGVEADLTVVPMRGLTLSANYVYTDAPPTPVRNPFTGATDTIYSNFTNKHAASFALDYKFPRLGFAQPRIHLSGETAGGARWAQTPQFKSSKAFIVNGRLTLAEIDLAGSDLELALWGKNLFDKAFDLLTINLTGIGRQRYGILNDPRTYGLEARMRF